MSESTMIEQELDITFGKYNDPSLRDMPDKMIEQLNQLSEMINKEPEHVIPGLTELVEKYNIPVLSNLLYAAYNMNNETDKAENVALDSYTNFPDYLFSKVNYAHICLLKGDLDKIEDIFSNKFDLRTLYPQRKKFHISEFISFSGITCLFFYEKGALKKAKEILDALEKIVPDDQMTKILKQKINTSFITKLITKVFK